MKSKLVNLSKVHFLPWNKKENLEDFLNTAGLNNFVSKDMSVAIKMHFGEEGNTGYVKPQFIKPVISILKESGGNPFLTDTNTIYHGRRNNAKGHIAVANKHGFSTQKLGVPIAIADGELGNDFTEIKINGYHFKHVKIAKAIVDCPNMVVVSHFKGHLMAGFGGAIKNLGMGCGARIGKFEMHSSVSPAISLKKCTGCGNCVQICSHNAMEITDKKIRIDKLKCAGCGECIIECPTQALSITWNESSKNVQEKFAEYAAGAVKDRNVFYITFINNVTANCDCISEGEPSLVPDTGIMASNDPVAIDQAALDMVLKTANNDIFKEAHPHIDYNVQLSHAENIGLGTRKYLLL